MPPGIKFSYLSGSIIRKREHYSWLKMTPLKMKLKRAVNTMLGNVLLKWSKAKSINIVGNRKMINIILAFQEEDAVTECKIEK